MCIQVSGNGKLHYGAGKQSASTSTATSRRTFRRRARKLETFPLTKSRGEGVEQFICRARALSATCEYGALAAEMLRDKIVVGVADHSLRRQLLSDAKLTLQTAIDTFRAHEATNYQLQQIEMPHTTEEVVNWTASKHKKTKEKEERVQPRGQGIRITQCFYCGGSHLRKKELCPAYENHRSATDSSRVAAIPVKYQHQKEMDYSSGNGGPGARDKSKVGYRDHIQQQTDNILGTRWRAILVAPISLGTVDSTRGFQRALMETLRGLNGVAVIADNISARESTGKQVTYMDHVLSADGLKADPQKVQAIQGMQRFLRMVNYLAKFLPSLATLSEPLRQLTCQDTTWVWDSAQQQAFVNIKTAVSTTPVLQYYNQWNYKLQEDLNQGHDSDQEVIKPLQNISMHQHLNVTHTTLSRIQQCTTADGGLQAFATIIKEGWPERKSDVPERVREYWHCRDELSVYYSTIFRGERLVVPQEMRAEILQKAHASHQGLEASLRKVRDTLYWPRMKDDVERTIIPHASPAQSSRLCPEHRISSTLLHPSYHPRGNGKAEASVKIAKNIMNKCLQTKSHTWLTLLEWHNIPTSGLTTSPVQRLMSRRTRTQMRTSTELLKPRVLERVPELEKKQKYKSQEVYIKPAPQAASKFWSPETITQQLSSHSYEAITKEGTRVRQNREALQSTNSRVDTHIEGQGLHLENAVQNNHWRQ
ncbi:hypothetical protein PR048_000535 [Dryococelus australis]|uniref:RNA-directed DNA polymerase n=1 Tax=Dryococelus australis TaxID=614101 RepID=A0ABQ9IGB6_9NEOP|nr:hypothetical protein PR048_000535 [Dryococelus australis]